MKCAQLGTRLSVKMKDLTSENLEPLKKSDLRKGTSLIADYKGKSYPVIFEAFAGKYYTSVNCEHVRKLCGYMLFVYVYTIYFYLNIQGGRVLTVAVR